MPLVVGRSRRREARYHGQGKREARAVAVQSVSLYSLFKPRSIHRKAHTVLWCVVCVVCDVSTGEGIEPSIACATGDADTQPPLDQNLDSTKWEHFADVLSISQLLHEQRYLISPPFGSKRVGVRNGLQRLQSLQRPRTVTSWPPCSSLQTYRQSFLDLH